MSTEDSATVKAPSSNEKDTVSPSTSIPSQPKQRQPVSLEPHNVLLLLIGLRLLNGLAVETFFQPDEYFQALEPAWQWAFGEGAGAWITWEWKHHLRSAIHPTIFGLCYRLADSIAELLKLEGHARSEVLLAAPKILQAVFAALGDFYTWKLASYIYGAKSAASSAALALTVVSPWQWFCSTRTFSNSLETTLTVIALYDWPWHSALPLRSRDATGTNIDAQHSVHIREDSTSKAKSTDEVTRLRRTLLCAAVATILRPTNILVWMILTWFTFIANWTSLQTEGMLFASETVLCGSTILLFSTIIDRMFYEAWVFPPLNFLRVNVVQSLASFYGSNDWHYYVSQGYPLLLTTALPFTLIGLYRTLSSKRVKTVEATPAGRHALYLLSIICVLVPAAFSFIAHKEVRFIYPLLPALHIITALPVALFCGSLMDQSPSLSPKLPRRLLLFLLLILNLTISYYTAQIHNSGIINLTHYLRHEFETFYLSSLTPSNMTIGMLMPCHSTPWRSHLQYTPTSALPGIRGWALTCEPPLNLNMSEKASYLDEADQFYANPSLWVKKHMSRHFPSPRSDTVVFPTPNYGKINTLDTELLERDHAENYWTTHEGRKPWPDYLVFFAQLEPTLQFVLRGSGYSECKQLFNSHWHDDRRRQGNIVIWCLDPVRQEEQRREKMGLGSGSIGMKEVKEAIHEPIETAEGGMKGQKILGGSGAKKAKLKKEPLRRVVEKPFWKVREPEDD